GGKNCGAGDQELVSAAVTICAICFKSVKMKRRVIYLANIRNLSRAASAPSSPPPAAVPSFRRKRAGLRNSHDPLRGHVLKQCSPNCTAHLRQNEAALRGNKVKT
ncbi:MAG: hypothetical protein PHF75_09555, partial [Gallionella sp.]|nr:hypothetical protein [Gallionella sp.]